MFHIEKCKIFGQLIYDTFNIIKCQEYDSDQLKRQLSYIKLQMHMNQTPFQLLQRQDKQRKVKVLNNIQRKDLKRRSISYNLKVGDNYQCDENDKSEVREQYSTIAINNSIKKSYYYRKIFNKSIDTHMTHDQFRRVKQTFDQMARQDQNNQNRASFFRELWEKQIVRKEDRYHLNERQNYLQVISTKNHQRQKYIQQESQIQSRKKEEILAKNIFDIAQQRKAGLDFDLQILGKKKSIRIKDSRNKLRVNRTLTAEKEAKGEQSMFKFLIDVQNKQQEQSPSKEKCSFFKRFQQQNLIPKHQSVANDFLQITKLNNNKFPINPPKRIQTNKLKQLRLRYNQSEFQENDKKQIARQIKSCWKVNRISQLRPNKLQTSEDKKRPVLQRISKVKFPIFTNDIKGWVVGQNDQQLLQELN